MATPTAQIKRMGGMMVGLDTIERLDLEMRLVATRLEGVTVNAQIVASSFSPMYSVKIYGVMTTLM
jgi:hypothetical protein